MKTIVIVAVTVGMLGATPSPSNRAHVVDCAPAPDCIEVEQLFGDTFPWQEQGPVEFLDRLRVRPEDLIKAATPYVAVGRHYEGRIFVRLVPTRCHSFVIYRDHQALIESRRENALDRNLSKRLNLYERLGGCRGVTSILNDHSAEATARRILSRAGFDPESRTRRP